MHRYLVTSALPYANGPIHFGHVIGAYLPADVYVRTLRLLGEDVRFICGSDEHGVAITIGAEAGGSEYEDYVARWHAEIAGLFERLGIEFDIFSGTSTCPEHSETAQDIFRQLDAAGYLEQRSTEQLFCNACQRFLADRYVTGVCPDCGEAGARGDECPACGTWIDALKLGDPQCKVCSASPVKRSTTHWYLDMPRIRDEFLGKWIEDHEWKPNVAAFIRNMMKDVPLRPITRDLAWGVPVPPELAGDETGKVLYVWFDAPIGYISMTKEWARQAGNPEAWRDYWQDPETRLVHFIGKDNIPHHCLLFPAMLHAADQGYVLPWQVPANEFYNLEGGKFSTSQERTIPLDRFFESYDPEIARFYLLSSAPETADSEWRWDEFQRCANTSLAGTIGNLVTRVLRFIDKHFDGQLPPLADEHRQELDELILNQCGAIVDPATSVQAFRFRRATEELVANASVANVFVDRTAPWALRKTDPQRCASVLRTCCEYLAWIARWMSPFMPGKAQALWTMLGQVGAVTADGWPGLPEAPAWRQLPDDGSLGEVTGLFPRIDDATVAAESEALTN
ncbi:MAG: methionine--tRNA ligase [Planctomycetota bacterium]|nr:methionine--tRNA ligase [Planctomycetota bacterium]MDP6838442.1 methionine--tRNA ligase [Planctomycetota bacterium]